MNDIFDFDDGLLDIDEEVWIGGMPFDILDLDYEDARIRRLAVERAERLAAERGALAHFSDAAARALRAGLY